LRSWQTRVDTYPREDGVKLYEALPFVPGITEFQLMRGIVGERHKKFAVLLKDYSRSHDKDHAVGRCSAHGIRGARPATVAVTRRSTVKVLSFLCKN